MKKLISTVLVSGVLLTALSGCERAAIEPSDTQTQQTLASTEALPSNQIPLPEDLPKPIKTYDEILNRCLHLAQVKLSELDLTKYFYENYDHTSEIERAIYQTVLYLDAERLGYVRASFKGCSGEQLALIDFDQRLGAIFTTVDGEIKLVGMFEGQTNPKTVLMKRYGNTDYTLLQAVSGKEDVWCRKALRISDRGELEEINRFGCRFRDGKFEYYQTQNGDFEVLDRAQVDKLLQAYGWSGENSFENYYPAEPDKWLGVTLLGRIWVPEVYCSVLRGETPYINQQGYERFFANSVFPSYTTWAYLADMDGDGSVEMLVKCWEGEVLILRATATGVFGYWIPDENLELTSYGTLLWRKYFNSVSEYGEKRVRFINGACVFEEIWHIERGYSPAYTRYFIGEREVSEEKFFATDYNGKDEGAPALRLWRAIDAGK